MFRVFVVDKFIAVLLVKLLILRITVPSTILYGVVSVASAVEPEVTTVTGTLTAAPPLMESVTLQELHCWYN